MSNQALQYKGSSNYIVSDELRNSVNIAMALGKPLLIKGEPGTGKNYASWKYCWFIKQRTAYMEY